MSQYKIFFTGPVGAGKTTAIHSICDVPPKIPHRKSSTTVAMDYGIMNLTGGEKLHLYRTPGPEHSDFMSDLLTTGGIGLILLIDNTGTDPFQDMKFFLNSFDKFIAKTSVAIGVTRMDQSKKPTIHDYNMQLHEFYPKPPVFTIDPNVKNDVSLLVQALLYSLDPGLED